MFNKLFITLFLMSVSSLIAVAQNIVRTSEIELIPPVDLEDGTVHFSFSTGKTEWVPTYTLFEAPLEKISKNQARRQQSHDEVIFTLFGGIIPGISPIMVLSKSETEAILLTGIFPEKDVLRDSQRMDREHCYILKDQTDNTFYVFMLKDVSPARAWLEIRHIHIHDGADWKGNPDLMALLEASSKIEQTSVRSIVISSQTHVRNLEEGREKEVSANRNDLKTFYPAAAKVGDIDFFFLGRSQAQSEKITFKKELLNAGCDYFDDVDVYPSKGNTLLLCLNKRCTIIPDDKLESLCSQPARLIGDYCGVPMDDTATEQPMVMLETHSKRLFLIVGRNKNNNEVLYYEIPQDGISKEQAKEIRAFRSLQKKKNWADIRFVQSVQERERKAVERKTAEAQAKQDALDQRIEAVIQSGETFPKTQEEINLVEELILKAKYEELLKLCEGKKLDFRVKGRNPLLLDAIDQNTRNKSQAFLSNKILILEFLLKNGCVSELSSDTAFNCVYYTIVTNNKAAFFMLLKYGFDLNRKDTRGKRVSEYVLVSLNNGMIDSEIAEKLRETKLPMAAMVSLNDLDGIKEAFQIKDNLELINKKDEQGKTLLDYALQPDKKSDMNMVRFLLDAGATPNKDTLLYQIIACNKNEFIPLLWEHRSALSNEVWFEAFLRIAENQDADVFRFFLEHGFDPLTKDKRGKSAAVRVFLSGSKEMADMLVERGIKKPFWAAVKWNDLEMAKEYLDAGTDVNAVDPDSPDSPLALAVGMKNLEMAELLIQHGAYISPKKYYDNKKSYPLKVIVGEKNGEQMTELLLKNGFVPDYPKTPGDTKHAAESSALYRALSNKQYETARILLRYGARTDVTVEKVFLDEGKKDLISKDVGLEELFRYDPEALKILGKKSGFLNFD